MILILPRRSLAKGRKWQPYILAAIDDLVGTLWMPYEAAMFENIPYNSKMECPLLFFIQVSLGLVGTCEAY